MHDLGPAHVAPHDRSLGRSRAVPARGSSPRVRGARLRVVVGAGLLSLVTATSALGVLATTAAPARAGTASSVYETEAFTATNVQRIAHDRAALRPGACLHKWAVRQARKMADQRRMFHQDLERVADDCGLSYAGENVAYGYATGTAVVRAWMDSPGHRANILNRHYRAMGIGARQADGVWYVAQVFGRKAL